MSLLPPPSHPASLTSERDITFHSAVDVWLPLTYRLSPGKSESRCSFFSSSPPVPPQAGNAFLTPQRRLGVVRSRILCFPCYNVCVVSLLKTRDTGLSFLVVLYSFSFLFQVLIKHLNKFKEKSWSGDLGEGLDALGLCSLPPPAGRAPSLGHFSIHVWGCKRSAPSMPCPLSPCPRGPGTNRRRSFALEGLSGRRVLLGKWLERGSGDKTGAASGLGSALSPWGPLRGHRGLSREPCRQVGWVCWALGTGSWPAQRGADLRWSLTLPAEMLGEGACSYSSWPHGARAGPRSPRRGCGQGRQLAGQVPNTWPRGRWAGLPGLLGARWTGDCWTGTSWRGPYSRCRLSSSLSGGFSSGGPSARSTWCLWGLAASRSELPGCCFLAAGLLPSFDDP